MEPALFEAYVGRPLPPAAQATFRGGELSLQEKGRVLPLVVNVLGRATEQESILLAKMTHRWGSLASMGAGTIMGLEGRPLFTRRLAVWDHLMTPRAYGEGTWVQK